MYGRAGTLLSTHPVTVKDVTRRGASGRTCYGGQSAFTDMTCRAHPMAATAPAQIRPFQPGDHSQVLALAPRLTEGVAPWRDPAAVRRAAQNWVQTSIDTAHQPDHAVYVAIAMDRVVGVVTIREQTHFTGQTDAYVGELAVASGMERRGIATALMNAAEAWAAQRGLAFLTLQTGAANHRARGLYRRLGYHEEELLLTKAISGRHKPF
jgi:ribosomal protein S18 acetylase RimI-like enzyme